MFWLKQAKIWVQASPSFAEHSSSPGCWTWVKTTMKWYWYDKSGWKVARQKKDWGCWLAWASTVSKWSRRPMASLSASEIMWPTQPGKWLSSSMSSSMWLWWDYTLSAVFNFGPFTTRLLSYSSVCKEAQQNW